MLSPSILNTHKLHIRRLFPSFFNFYWKYWSKSYCYFRKVTVPYPVPAPSVSYSAPVVVGHGLYDHSYGSYGHGIYSSSYRAPYYSSSGIKVITASPSYKSYHHGGYHGGYHSGYHSHHGGYHSHYGGGLGISIGSKYDWPLKFGLKYHGWWWILCKCSISLKKIIFCATKKICHIFNDCMSTFHILLIV